VNVRPRGVAIGLAVAVLCAVAASAQVRAETFTATASVKHGSASATAPVTVTVTRYASGAEREAVMKAVRDGGSAAVRSALAAMPDAGFIQLGERRTTIRFAGERTTGSGRLITVVTGEPILFVGAGIPAAKPRTGFDVAVAMLDLNDAGGGLGELAPAARVGLDEGGAFLIEDYGSTVVWLKDLVRAK
jgi:hypothetical protein